MDKVIEQPTKINYYHCMAFFQTAFAHATDAELSKEEARTSAMGLLQWMDADDAYTEEYFKEIWQEVSKWYSSILKAENGPDGPEMQSAIQLSMNTINDAFNEQDPDSGIGLKNDFVNLLIKIAGSDGEVKEIEHEWLLHVCRIFGIDPPWRD